MEKVSLNIEGTSDEIIGALKKLAGLVEQRDEEISLDENWSEEEIQKFWSMLTDGAKEAFRIIAKFPTGCHRNLVLKELGISGNQLAGRLSSQGHTLRNFPNKPCPVELDWNTWEYKMRPEFVEAITELGFIF